MAYRGAAFGQRHQVAGDFIELAMNRNPLQVTQKLYDAYDPAVCALTAKPEMVCESGQVKIKAPIGTQANVGPFAIKVQSDTPTQMSGSVIPPKLSGTTTVNGINYKFTAEVKYSAEVTWHPKPRGQQPEPVRVTQPQEKRAINSDRGVDWGKVAQHADKLAALVTITIMTYFAPTIRMWMSSSGATTSMMPFTHTIDRSRHGYPGDA